MVLRVGFFGTPRFAAEILKFLLDAGIEVVGVVTKPDRPQGRSLQVGESAVKELLSKLELKTPIFQPEKASNPVFLAELAKLKADLFVVVAFGQILPESLLKIPPKGCVNVHASLLPKYRGAAPMQRSLMQGEKETGIAIQKMVKELDAGDVIATAKMEVSPSMTLGELEKELCELAKPLLLLVLREYEKGDPQAEPQNHSLATLAPKVKVEEGEIHWNRPAEELHNLVRAFSPRPGAWCWIKIGEEKKRLKILRTIVVAKPGEVGKILSDDGIVGCLDSAIQLLEVQPEGKKGMLAKDWLRGLRSFPKLYI
ncbi:MAG: methionyl-tRNA formyltransferase [Chlamydiae bacterium]|nr:methionyl-tRNA formyltransferase [Chlamydiota bacterium]